MTKIEQIDVHPRNNGFGAVRWTERLITNLPQRGATFFGRTIGIYDYMNSYNTDIEKLEDLHARANKFRELNIWIDNSPKKCKNAHSRICGDFPGLGKDAVLDINLDMDEVRKWRDYEYVGLTVAVSLDRLLKTVWENDMVQMGLDLHMPIKSLNLIKNWWELPSASGRSIITHAVEKGIAAGLASAVVEGEDCTVYRDVVIEGWQEQEDKILALPDAKRREENF